MTFDQLEPSAKAPCTRTMFFTAALCTMMEPPPIAIPAMKIVTSLSKKRACDLPSPLDFKRSHVSVSCLLWLILTFVAVQTICEGETGNRHPAFSGAMSAHTPDV